MDPRTIQQALGRYAYDFRDQSTPSVTKRTSGNTAESATSILTSNDNAAHVQDKKVSLEADIAVSPRKALYVNTRGRDAVIPKGN
ncbi:hypothetical protein ONS95_004307 [Cadophora gregata]|uniref:uncharacterized protein n=1 Tax=Cadophora gregata TaxID=51156 RepID=UPI0026DB6EB3|nr:uncharacterized protein ONS95_004307 [Cadophora gregata]KAK0105790.1 hypothetical protein ONS95_004307 [Cadophora gregata]